MQQVTNGGGKFTDDPKRPDGRGTKGVSVSGLLHSTNGNGAIEHDKLDEALA